jgi:hypothetical protein
MGMARSLNRNGSRRHINHGHFYLALEPYIRRTWPELLVSWARILSGEFTDPLVGRDLIFGNSTRPGTSKPLGEFGCVAVLLTHSRRDTLLRASHIGIHFGISGRHITKVQRQSHEQYRGSVGDVSHGQTHKAEMDRRDHRRSLLDCAECQRLQLFVGSTDRFGFWSHRSLCDRASWAAAYVLHVHFNFRAMEHATFFLF